MRITILLLMQQLGVKKEIIEPPFNKLAIGN